MGRWDSEVEAIGRYCGKDCKLKLAEPSSCSDMACPLWPWRGGKRHEAGKAARKQKKGGQHG